MCSPRRKQCGAPACRKAFQADRMRDYYQRVGGNKNVKPEHRDVANANVAAKRAARQAAGLPARPWTESRKAADQRRRAAKRGAEVEKFTSLEIFERDGWKCGICGRKVDPELTWPHPESASLDHIVPLSQDGEHSRANTRLAHLDCNIQRGDRGGNEQLSLVG